MKLEMHLFANIKWSHDRWVTWLDGCGQLNLSYTLLKLVAIVLAKMELFFHITWSYDHWVTWLGGWDTLTLNLIVKATEPNKIYIYIYITNWGKLVLQCGAALFYCKSGQTLLQIRGASFLQIGASFVTNWGSYLQIRATTIAK